MIVILSILEIMNIWKIDRLITLLGILTVPRLITTFFVLGRGTILGILILLEMLTILEMTFQVLVTVLRVVTVLWMVTILGTLDTDYPQDSYHTKRIYGYLFSGILLLKLTGTCWLEGRHDLDDFQPDISIGSKKKLGSNKMKVQNIQRQNKLWGEKNWPKKFGCKKCLG